MRSMEQLWESHTIDGSSTGPSSRSQRLGPHPPDPEGVHRTKVRRGMQVSGGVAFRLTERADPRRSRAPLVEGLASSSGAGGRKSLLEGPPERTF